MAGAGTATGDTTTIGAMNITAVGAVMAVGAGADTLGVASAAAANTGAVAAVTGVRIER